MTAGFPMKVADLIAATTFPFESWATAHGFKYPGAELPLLRQCGSAAEAYFVRAYLTRAWQGERPAITLQVPCAGYRIDAVVRDERGSLAIEIDGMAWHHRTPEQVADDYLRQRRIVARGYTVIRFTAPEVFSDADECWRQVDAILAARGRV